MTVYQYGHESFAPGKDYMFLYSSSVYIYIIYYDIYIYSPFCTSLARESEGIQRSPTHLFGSHRPGSYRPQCVAPAAVVGGTAGPRFRREDTGGTKPHPNILQAALGFSFF